MWTIYEVECREPGYRYVGQTLSIPSRFEAHTTGHSTAFINRHGGLRGFRVIEEGLTTRAAAIKRETFHAQRLLLEGFIVGGPWSTDLWPEHQLTRYRKQIGLDRQGEAQGITP